MQIPYIKTITLYIYYDKLLTFLSKKSIVIFQGIKQKTSLYLTVLGLFLLYKIHHLNVIRKLSTTWVYKKKNKEGIDIIKILSYFSKNL